LLYPAEEGQLLEILGLGLEIGHRNHPPEKLVKETQRDHQQLGLAAYLDR
jgi:hypothetical protein